MCWFKYLEIEAINTRPRSKLEMCEEVNEEGEEVLFHMSMDIEEIREGEMVNGLRNEFLNFSLDQSMIACCFIETQRFIRFRNSDFLETHFTFEVDSEEGGNTHAVTQVTKLFRRTQS